MERLFIEASVEDSIIEVDNKLLVKDRWAIKKELW